MSDRAWSGSGVEEIVGESVALKPALASAKRLAETNAAVLIAGERGVGKELFARLIHQLSPRRNKVFLKANCVSTAPELLDRELFGFEKGVFDGATSGKSGYLELADGGTLFLYEVTRIPLDLQSKLLQALKLGKFERLGNARVIRANVRLIATTIQNQEKLCGSRLQPGLYDQFHTSSIRIPPLRDRREDIPLLANYFVQKFARRMNKPVPRIAHETEKALLNHSWPGNVTQLESFLQRSVILTDGSTLHAPLDEL